MWDGERFPGPLDHLVDRPGRDLDAEQLAGELGRVAARDTVSDRERHDRRLEPGAERRPCRPGKLGVRVGLALRAAHTVESVLGHPDRDRRQFSDLMPPQLARVDQLRRVEHTRARPTPLRPMLDDLVDLVGSEQSPVPALMPLLAPTLPARRLPVRTQRRRRRILRRRQRRVPRAPLQPPLELSHPSLKPLICLNELPDPQQQRNRGLTTTIKDPLRLRPIHTTTFAARTEVPSPGYRRYAGTASLSFLAASISFCAMCAGTSS